MNYDFLLDLDLLSPSPVDGDELLLRFLLRRAIRNEWLWSDAIAVAGVGTAS